MLDFNNLLDPKDIDGKINKSLSSSFFMRFFLAWLLWNWKAISIILLISEKAVPVSAGIANKIDYAQALYPDFQHAIICLLIGPAITTTVAYFILEACSTVGYWIKKWFWKWKMKITNHIEQYTPATYMTARYFTLQIGKLESIRDDNAVKLNRKQDDIDALLKKLEEQKTAYDSRLANMEDTKGRIIEQKAEAIYAETIVSPNAEKIFRSFKDTWKKITNSEDGKYQFSRPSPELQFHTDREVFAKVGVYHTITEVGKALNNIIVIRGPWTD